MIYMTQYQDMLEEEIFGIKGKRLIYNGKFYEYADDDRYKEIIQRRGKRWK